MNGAVLLDTGPLVAFLAADSIHSAWARDQWERTTPPMLVCEPVLTEAAFILKREGADPDAILATNEAFAPEPDLVFLLDCAPERTLQRIRARGDEPDAFEKLENLNRVREIFLSIKKPYIRVLDASQNAEAVAQDALSHFRHAVPSGS